MINNLINNIKAAFKFLLADQDKANSRLVFLMHGAATAIGILVLSVSFPFVKNRDGFAVMVTAIGGGGVGSAIGRYFTKLGDDKTPPQP